MLNFKQLILDDSNETTIINLENVKIWTIGVKEVIRDEESTTFTIRVTVDGVEYLATHKFLGTISKEVYFTFKADVLNGVNSPQFLCLSYDNPDHINTLTVKMNYICTGYIITTSSYSIDGIKPKRPKRMNREKDVFEEEDFNCIEDEQ